MRKNFTLLFLLGIFGLFTTNLFAQQDATIDPADIRYWIGEGENEVVFIVNWAEPDTALAWGYRFADETVTLKNVMDKIAEADYRFGYESFDSGTGYWLVDLTFNDGILNLSLTEQYYAAYVVNGDPSWNTFDVQTLGNGDYVKWGDTYCGTMVDPENWIFVWEEEVVPVYPLANEAKIDPSEIRYWVGEGSNEVVFAVNWNNPNMCYAWGYRFNENEITVQTVMDAIAEADPRYNYTAANGWLNEMTYHAVDLSLTLSGMYSMYNINGFVAWNSYDVQTVVDGDFIKWGDITCGTEIAPWTYVWESEVMAVYPLADEAKIDPSEIRYWIGEGSNEVVFAINWNEPDTCLAWGYRFNENEITVQTVMDAIAEADQRFDYNAADGWINEMTYHAGNLTLTLSGMNAMYNINGLAAWNSYDVQTVVNSDFIKWGDISCGTEIAPWTYVWTQTVVPVSNPTGMNEIQTNTLSVYPNPAVSETFVILESAGLNEVMVYDIQGRLVSKESVNAIAGEQVRISTENLNAGVYFITVSNDSAVRTAKLVVR